MGLKEYKKKRDFKITAEPEGKEQPKSAGDSFVIQKHAASRLHYDFRLELDGVLKSWAVPKGPSYDTADKRLAVHVEDHPIEYGTFEGIIPQGQYGGGTVMLWDRGTWEPIGNAKKDYYAGNLKFRLHGEKLEGAWALIRMGGKSGDDGKNWLLIKERDEHVRPISEYDVVEELDKSVATGRTMEEVAEEQDAVWQSNREEKKTKAAAKKADAPKVKAKTKITASAGNGRAKASAKKKAAGKAKKGETEEDEPSPQPSPAGRGSRTKSPSGPSPAGLPGARKAAQPEFLQPQLATLVKEVPQGERWLHELKFDGYRLLAIIKNGKVKLFTRNGNDWTANFRAIVPSLEKLGVEDAIFDGELVVLKADGTTDFQTLQNAIKGDARASFVYYIFDIPHYEGYDLARVPLLERKIFLREVLAHAPESKHLRYSDHIQGNGDAVFQNACNYKMEGIISKRADSPYEQRRSQGWVKVKCIKRQEFVIGGYTDPSGARSLFGALVLGIYDDDGKFVYCGRVGTGFNDKSLREVHTALKKIERPKTAFDKPPRGPDARGVHWVEPKLTAEVEFTEWTEESILRHPSFKGMREDKDPREIKREEAQPISPAPPEQSGTGVSPVSSTANKKVAPVKASSSATEDTATIAGVTISNPGRVMYPDQGVTKLDLAHYYEQVQDYILPFIAKRPLTLVRCPQGRQQKCFYQKHVTESSPDAIYSIGIQEKDGIGQYLAIKDVKGLISLVQIGALELHPWGSKEDKIEYPDQLIFDLDPDVGLDYPAVVDATFIVRDRLEEMGLRTFVKTSGGKGLHVCVPIARTMDWDETKAFAKAFAENMVAREPKRFVSNMSKAKRVGKIFLDYLRNGRGATSVAAYSTRARQGAPVSTPIFWEELSPKLSPAAFTLENLPARLKSQKKDPWADFFKVKQTVTAKMKKEVGM